MNKLKNTPFITYATMFICIIINILVSRTGMERTTEGAILLGAYYKAFVMAGEWWRLLTSGFVHIHVVHLFVNMMALVSFGPTMEEKLGHAKFALILFGSTISGSLFMFCADGNIVAVGLSGGLYGLAAAISYSLISSGGWKVPAIRMYLLRLWMINLLVNFMPNIGVSAHIGGAVFGLIVYVLMDKNNTYAYLRKHFAIAGAAILIALAIFVRGACVRKIPEDEQYLGTDIPLLEKVSDLGLKSYALHMAKNLDELYDSYIIEYEIAEYQLK